MLLDNGAIPTLKMISKVPNSDMDSMGEWSTHNTHIWKLLFNARGMRGIQYPSEDEIKRHILPYKDRLDFLLKMDFTKKKWGHF